MGNISLVGELPELTSAMARLEALAKAEGIEIATANFGGVRTAQDTTKILGYREDEYTLYVAKQKAAGKVPASIGTFRPIAPFGKSHHNYGAARDVRPLTYKGKQVATLDKVVDGAGFQAAHDRLDAIVESDAILKSALKIGDYFNDEPHFELRLTLDEARLKYMRYVATIGVVGVALLLLGAFAVWPSLRGA